MLLPLALASFLAAPDLVTVDYDPVEACFGRHVTGLEQWTRTRGRFQYRFASEETARIFDADPGNYSVQLGGGCARMGPLSGAGDPEIYTVHRGKLYVFASEGCRRGFLERPDALLWSPDPKPEPSAEQVRSGRQLLTKALDAMGGKEAFGALRSVLWTATQTHGEGENAATSERQLHFDFQGNLSLLRTSGDWSQAVHVRGKQGVLVEGGQVHELDESQRLAALRELHGEPLWLLARRNDPAVTVWGEKASGGSDVLGFHLGGVTTRLELGTTGHVQAVLQRRRDPSAGLTWTRIELAGSGSVGGIQVPLERRSAPSGRQVEGLDRNWKQIRTDEPLPPMPEPSER